MTLRASPLSSKQKARILEAVEKKVPLPPVTHKYVMGLALTAAAVLLLPLLYFAMMILLAGLIFATVRYADHILPGWPALLRGTLVGLVVLLGTGLLLALLKPFLARTAAIKRPRALRKEAEPFLFEYINRLCDALGAPRPTAIHITCDLNAAAEIRRRWTGGGIRRGISLYIGLPLVAGMNLQQFTGILAHELGHFTQQTAMWLENMVRRTNHWLFTVAYERDAVDERLMQLSSMGGLVAICSLAILAMIWVSRWILYAFAMAGTAISCLMSREMEFNADRCEVRMVGAKALASAMRRLRELDVAQQTSLRDISAFYDEGRLPDDIIALSVANAGFITPRVKSKIREMMTQQKSSLLDTHPSDRDRILAAERDGSPGQFPREISGEKFPATILFDRFREISKGVTEQFYRDSLNDKFSQRLIHPVEKMLQRQTEEINAGKALRRYFQTEIPLLRPLPIAPQSTAAPENPDEIVSHLKRARERMIEELPTYQRISPRYRYAEEVLFDTIAAQILLQAQVPFPPAQYRLTDASAPAVETKLERARDGVMVLAGKMLAFETEAGDRLSFALQLLHVPDLIEKISDGENLWYEVDDLLPQAQYVSRLIGELPSLRTTTHRLMTLWEHCASRELSPRVLKLLQTQLSTLKSRLETIQQEMGNQLYPFDHARADITLRDYALPHVPEEQDLGGLIDVAYQMQSRLTTIQLRLFARLARAAEKIEDALGMPALPEPESGDDV
ncbi:M48 family metallopeptidase [Schlesneria sp. T3-172]|uniref:M48 family metallopeptidase n=1 Tax=Schlesneria sphaerica TaxID=3373610 RepID=UPI0037C6A339